ncbi:DNAase [Paenibacillus sp. PK3_47]|uniref:TatD family hydrolase n=1 Tax=Paenibacillus sp. PK3_47 TaxID=2072642 RepID=UPI00201D4D2A|nr:TatD family hydrolase [Paenibacillus sp. PK3_47]UQZ35160.1 DNAase [Paenibacillus sp. PK3_47]
MIDAHIHLEQYLEGQSPEALDSMLQVLPGQGIDKLIAVSMNLESCRRTRQIAALHPQLVKPAYGFHPEQPLPSGTELAALLEWINQHGEEMVAVGEVGLPYYSRAEALARGEDFDMEPYIRLLDILLEAAARLNKPAVLHAVYEDALTACALLEKHGITKAHFHWFKGPRKAVELMIERGYYISFTPDIVYEPEIQELARMYPPQLVMAETDGPWPFEGPFTGKSTHPAMIHEVAAVWGSLHGYSPAQAADLLTANTLCFYGL